MSMAVRAPTSKRPVPSSVSKMRDRKRRRIAVESSHGTTTDSKASASEKPLNELQWRAVSPPALDDYEGFYGLEEIDDVEVLKDEVTGTVTFRNAGQLLKKTDARSADVLETLHPEMQTESPETNAGASDDAWDGFSDAEPADVPAVSVAPSKLDIKKKSYPRTEEIVKKTTVSSAPDLTQSETGSSMNAFHSLEDNLEAEEDVDISAWKILDLDSALMPALSRLKFSQPTAIQAAAIPMVKAGQDLIGKAPTGSGKTLAFGLPILERWLVKQSSDNENNETLAPSTPTALIILPTRELAHQIHKHLTALCVDITLQSLRIATLTGGLSIQKQRRLVERADVIIATPGRLWEVMSESQDTLARIQKVDMLVIDEADRLLSQGHFQELEQVLTALDRRTEEQSDEDARDNELKQRPPRQTLMFSATLHRDLQQKLSKQSKHYSDTDSKGSMAYLLKKLKFRMQPQFVDVNPNSQMASNLYERMLEVPVGTDKDLYLYALLSLHRPQPQTRSLVFVNSIAAVRRLVPFLQNLELSALPLHSQMEQKARLRSVERFTSSKSGSATNGRPSTTSILIATDIAARGLDIPDVHLVIHYHIPRTADGYVHRSGRTARAAANGTSVLMCAPTEAAGVRRLVAKVHAKKSSRKHQELQMIELEGKVISRLRPRASLAKTIADAEQAKEKDNSANLWMSEAADDLGVDVEEEFGTGGGEKGQGGGRGKKRKEREQRSRSMTRSDIKSAKSELRDMLTRKVNIGVSERYLTSGNVDINALLEERSRGSGENIGGFLGRVCDAGMS